MITCCATFIHLSLCSSIVRISHWSSEGYRLYTYVTSLIISVHVAQWLEYLTSHQNVTGCTHICNLHLSQSSSMVRASALATKIKVTGCARMLPVYILTFAFALRLSLSNSIVKASLTQ